MHCNDRIADNAIISDLGAELGNPQEYVRRVLERMTTCGIARDKVQVRIGVTGKGIIPFFRLEKPLEGITPTDVDTGEVLDIEIPWTEQVYRGTGQQVDTLSETNLKHMNWSSRSMSFAEVQDYLGQLRGFRRKVAK